MTLALLAALIGTFGYGVASVLQAIGAGRASGLAVIRHPAYLAGLACDGVAWLASLVALQHLPLFAVQSLLAGSLGVTVVLARAFLGARLRRRDVAAVAVIILALATVSRASGSQSAQPAPHGFQAATLTVLLVMVVVTVVLYREAGSLPLAALAGLAFSGAAMCARAVHSSNVWSQMLSEPLAWAVLGFGAIGALSYARSLERGQVGPATAVLWGVEVLVPGIVGVVVLGDRVRPGWAFPSLLAVAAALAAGVVLATSPAQQSTTATMGRQPAG